ncbi:MAG: Ig-like domain-containing protein [Bacteroidota bacterium]
MIRLTALFSISLAFSCAQILNPGGGPKDTEAPVAVKYMPDSAARNFSGNEITIAFNEYIRLNDLSSQLVISPPVETQPEVRLVKNRIVNLEFKEPLKENTTYTINFGNAVTDITEGNVKENFTYVFSTGDYIDSLTLSGSVMYAQDLRPEKGVLVMLYSDHSDSVVFKRKPDYFGKTKADGSFQINNIRAGKYKVAALKDEDGDFLYTPVAEHIAFSDSLLDLQKNKKINLHLFKEKAKKLFVVRGASGYGSYTMIFSKPLEKIGIKGYNQTDTKNFIQEASAGLDTMTWWFPGFTDDSIQFYVDVNGQRFDTVNICGCALKKKKVNAPEKLEVRTNVIPGQLFDYSRHLSLTLSHPVAEKLTDKARAPVTDSAKLTLRTKSGPVPFVLSMNDIRHFRIAPRVTGFQPDSSYTLLILPGAFTDVFGLTNDSVKIEFKAQEAKYYGTLKVKATVKSEGAKIIELIDDKGNVVRSDVIKGNKDLFYEYLPPKNFRLRVIYDENNNGKWDTGDYSTKKQPEKVIYYNQPVNVRSNWDLELEWNL